MLNPQDIRDKKLLALDRELKTLNKERWLIKKLDEPIQRGWVRFHVLSERGLRHKDQPMLAEMLRVIGTKIWSKSSAFRAWNWHSKRRRQFIDIDQPLQAISASEWQHKNYPDQWRRYFLPQRVQGHWGSYLVFVCDHVRFFELKTEPLFVDELQVPNPLVAQRIAELESLIETRHLRPRLNWLLGYSAGRWNHDPRRRIGDRIAEREMRAALANCPEVDPAPCKVRSPISLLITLSPT
jgi:hypothetical protein